MAAKVSLKDHYDAVNSERRYADTMRSLAIIGTLGALILSIQQAAKVYAATASQLLSLHNDLIRKGERDTAETKREMATKAEVEPLKAFVDGERQSSVTTGKLITYLLSVAVIAVMVGIAIGNWMFK